MYYFIINNHPENKPFQDTPKAKKPGLSAGFSL